MQLKENHFFLSLRITFGAHYPIPRFFPVDGQQVWRNAASTRFVVARSVFCHTLNYIKNPEKDVQTVAQATVINTLYSSLSCRRRSDVTLKQLRRACGAFTSVPDNMPIQHFRVPLVPKSSGRSSAACRF